MLPFPEGNRHLHDRKPGFGDSPGHLDLERIPGSGDLVQVDSFENLSPKTFEAAGQVPDGYPQDSPRVEAAAAAQEPTDLPPLGDSSAWHVAGADNQVSKLRSREKPGQIRRVMREIGVHLDDQVCVGAKRNLESLQVGRTQTLLPGAVQDLDPRVLRRDPVRDPAGSIGRIIIHDQDPVVIVSQLRTQGFDHPIDVPGLVVGRQDHPGRSAVICAGLVRHRRIVPTGPGPGTGGRDATISTGYVMEWHG